MKTIDNVGRIEKSFSEKDFLRETLIYLYKSPSPQDIFDSAFKSVEEKEVEILCATADVNINYSCSVGFDREEQYLGQEEYYDYTDRQKRMRIVEKTRTVTDWKPHSGTASAQNVISCTRNVANVSNRIDEEELFLDILKNCKSKQCENAQITVNEDALESAKELCCFNCFVDVNLPGDRQKDTNYDGVADIKNLFGRIVTEYSVNFEYGGKEYRATAFGSGMPKISCEVPKNVKDIKEGTKKVNRKLSPLIVLGVVFCILGIVLGVVLGLKYMMLTTMAGGMLAILCIIIYFVIRWKLVKRTERLWKEKKLNDLNWLLSKYKLESYSD